MEKLNNVLYQALKNDINIALIKQDERMIKINIYHMDSCYSEQVTLFKEDMTILKSGGYNYTKKQQTLAERYLKAFNDASKRGMTRKAISLTKEYNDRYDKIYDIKYCLSSFVKEYEMY